MDRLIQSYLKGLETGALVIRVTFIRPSQCWPGNIGEPVQQQSVGFWDDLGAQLGDQQEAASCAGGHAPKEHHLEGEHEHLGAGDQQDGHGEGESFAVDEGVVVVMVSDPIL